MIYIVNNQELLCVVDEYDTPIEPCTRHEAFAKGHFRRTAHVWIINDKQEILCQQRSMKKDMGPGMWEPSVAGHLSPGDNYFTGAVREVKEETGIEIDPKDLKLVKIYKHEKFREYRGIFYYKHSKLKLNHIKREEDEVDQVKLIHVDEVKKNLLEDKHENWVQPDYAHEMFSVLN